MVCDTAGEAGVAGACCILTLMVVSYLALKQRT